MKTAKNCNPLVNELIDINVRQRELIKCLTQYVEEGGNDERMISALKNFSEKNFRIR